jgi:hypothetical protein
MTGNPQIGLGELRDRITESDVDKALVALREALCATEIVRGAKDGDSGHLSYVETPNYSVRLAAAKLMLDIKFPKEKGAKQKLTVNFPLGKGETMSETALKAIAERYVAELPKATSHPVANHEAV